MSKIIVLLQAHSYYTSKLNNNIVSLRKTYNHLACMFIKTF